MGWNAAATTEDTAAIQAALEYTERKMDLTQYSTCEIWIYAKDIRDYRLQLTRSVLTKIEIAALGGARL